MSPAVSSKSYVEGPAVYAESLVPASTHKKNEKSDNSDQPPDFSDVLKGEVQANAQPDKTKSNSTQPASQLKSDVSQGLAKSLPTMPPTSILTNLPASSNVTTGSATLPDAALTTQQNVPAPKYTPLVPNSETPTAPADDTQSSPTEDGTDQEAPSSTNTQQSYQGLVSGRYSYSSYLTSQTQTQIPTSKVAQKPASQPTTNSKEKKASDSSSSSSQASSSTSSSSYLNPLVLALNVQNTNDAVSTKSEATSDVSIQQKGSFGEKVSAPSQGSNESTPAPAGDSLLTADPLQTVSGSGLVPSTPVLPSGLGSVPALSSKQNSGLGSNAQVALPGQPQTSPLLTVSSLASLSENATGTGLVVPSANKKSADASPSIVDPADQVAQANASFNLQQQAPAVAQTTSQMPLSTATTTSSFMASNWSTMQLSLQLKKSATLSATDAKTPSVEKMSPSTPSQGTIFHSNSEPIFNQAFNASVSSGINQQASQALPSQVADLQSVVSGVTSSVKAVASGQAITATTVGTGHANENALANSNANLNLPDTLNPLSTSSMNSTSHKVLNSNSEFSGVLRQVVQDVRQDPSVTVLSPRRVSIEIQTPPGAVVNVYISKQNDQYRAQLSTSDPQALKWVQDQVSVLQQSPNTSSDIRWLPAQLDSQQKDESSRGGRSQDQPTPDEQNNKKKTAESQNPEDDFMNITTKIGGSV